MLTLSVHFVANSWLPQHIKNNNRIGFININDNNYAPTTTYDYDQWNINIQ